MNISRTSSLFLRASFFVLSIMAMLFLGNRNASAATRVFYDDLESGNTNLWSQGGSNDKCTNVLTAIDGNSPHGGSHMMQCNWNGSVAWNDPASYSSAVLGSWSYTNEFLIRMWVRVDNDVDHKFGSKWIRITGNYPTNSFIADGQMEQTGGPIYTNIECLDGTCNNWNNYGSGLIGNTQWHKLEFYSKGGGSSIFRIWVDDYLEWEKTGFSSSQKWNELNIISNWSDNGPEWAHDANNHTYWDDFEIYSDSTSGTPASGTMANGDVALNTTPDTTPPTSPIGLAANATSESSITVSWTAATDNIGVVRYDIERCTGLSCGNFAQIGTTQNSPYTDSGLTASTGYSYHVRAVDAAGNTSGWSNVVGATTQAPDTTPPTTPTNLQAATPTTGGSSTIDLTWTASTDNISVTNYQVERCPGSSCTTFSQVGTPTANSYQDTGLSASTTYRYRVRATDAANNTSSYSSVSQATTDQAPPVSDSLMLGLNFNEGSGTTTEDVSGHTNTGALQNGTSWNTTGKYSDSLTFDGVDDLVNIGNPSTLNLTSSLTLSAWVYPTSFSGDRDIITKVNDSSSDYHLQETNSGQIQVGFSSGGIWYTATTTTTLSLNTWTHVTGIFDDTNNTLTVYLNGVQSTQSTNITATLQSSTNPVHVGMGWSNQSWNGRIDDVRIYNTALTQSEIQTDMNTPLTTGGTSTPTSCSTVTPTNFTTSTYTGYGAPYDVFVSNTPLISTTCTSSDTHTINATLGITGDTTRIVYTKGYYYDPGISDWTSFTGTCTGALNGDWCQGSVSTTLTDTDISTTSASDPAYLVGMTCSIQGGRWKCGCRDTTCSTFYWQVQGAGM
ncbi:MAG: fibronectin type III domain-containing protein [Candidatus Moraniibacteriota bacterium]|nr:MAG: fibronectin type III domain-containing protein [Candidatus Moranbacteria bacterium]